MLPCLRLPGKALLHWSRRFGGPSTPPRWCKLDTDALPRHADLPMVPLTQRRDLQPPTLPCPSGAGKGLSCWRFCVGATQGPKIPKQGQTPHRLAGTLCGGLEHIPWLCPGTPVSSASSCPGVWPALDAEERLRCPRTPMERLVRCFANRELHQDGQGAAGGCNLPAPAAQSPPDPPANPDTSCLQQRQAWRPLVPKPPCSGQAAAPQAATAAR